MLCPFTFAEFAELRMNVQYLVPRLNGFSELFREPF